MKYIYMNLEEHPRGNLILERLIANGLVPSLIVEEVSETALKSREFTNRFLKKYAPTPLTQQLVEKHGLNRIVVSNLNEPLAVDAIKEISPDLILLGDTRIIKPQIIELVKDGIINIHPAYLPSVRGNNPYIWAIIHDMPQACSCHFIDNIVDNGPLISRRIVDIFHGDDIGDLIWRLNEVCASMAVETLKKYSQDNYLKAYPQNIETVETYSKATEDIISLASEKLKFGAYKHLKHSEYESI